ncbi:MAG: (Fe-S)-binding protein [Streptococcaceae bacterium]|jgi:L-lactate dehydrogenase complex protein LldE|nr:(Fe-S)-binding protein [Streptococcaceae bacterium]
MKVSLFSQCVVDLMFPEVGKSMVAVLERLGIETELPDHQVCCQQPTTNSGLVKTSLKGVRAQIDAFDGCDFVVGDAGSCVAALKELDQWFEPGDPYHKKARDLANRTFEFSQFLYHVLGMRQFGATFNGEKVTYHRSCHMTRLLGERTAPIEFIQKIDTLNYIEIPHIENCCGFGGTFSVKMPAISELMVTEKMNDIIATDAEILVSADMGCLMNIAGKFNREGKKIKALHIAEVLNHAVDVTKMDRPDFEHVSENIAKLHAELPDFEPIAERETVKFSYAERVKNGKMLVAK